MLNRLLVSIVVLLVIALPATALTASPGAEMAAAAPFDGTEASTAACAGFTAALPWKRPVPQPAAGCTAEYNCVHGTIVSCSSPVPGTCISSGGGCGWVSCNGQVTKCPGSCAGDHHCARFCNWAPNSYCDWGGCCVCQD